MDDTRITKEETMTKEWRFDGTLDAAKVSDIAAGIKLLSPYLDPSTLTFYNCGGSHVISIEITRES
jgi:hypothetical protein